MAELGKGGAMNKFIFLMTILFSFGACAGVDDLVGALHFYSSKGVIRKMAYPPHRVLSPLQVFRLSQGHGGLLNTIKTKSNGTVTLAYKMTHVDRTGEDFITNLRFIYHPDMKDVAPSRYEHVFLTKVSAFEDVMERFAERTDVAPKFVPWVRTAGESLQGRTEMRIEIGDLKKLDLADIEDLLIELARL